MRNFEINEQSEKRYMEGWLNRLIRWWYYFKAGTSQVSGLRAIAYGLIGLAGVFAVAKNGNYWIIAAIAIVIVPILTLLGWAQITRLDKTESYIGVTRASPFAKYGYELQEEILATLKRIEEKLK